MVWFLALPGCSGDVPTTMSTADTSPTPDSTDTGRVTTPPVPTTPPQFDCAAGPDPRGPWPEHPIRRDGATATAEALDFAGGLAEVRAGAELAGTVGQDVDLSVENAILVAKDFIGPNTTQANFWVADSSGVLLGWTNNDADSMARVEMLRNTRIGDAVSLQVTRVGLFRDMPEILAFEDLEATSSSNAVPVLDVVDPPVDLTYAEHGDDIVELWGRLDAIADADCGGATCYDLDYGAAGPALFRTSESGLEIGNCIHYVGPVAQFDGATRLDVGSFAWYRVLD